MSHANRGEDWEILLEQTFRRIKTCTVVKTTPPVQVVERVRGSKFMGFFKAPGMCDFEGGYRGRVVCLEAKESADRWNWQDKIPQHQRDRMQATADQCGIAGLVVRWRHKENPTKDFLWVVGWPQFCAINWPHKTISIGEARIACAAGYGAQLAYQYSFVAGVAPWMDRVLESYGGK